MSRNRWVIVFLSWVLSTLNQINTFREDPAGFTAGSIGAFLGSYLWVYFFGWIYDKYKPKVVKEYDLTVIKKK